MQARRMPDRHGFLPLPGVLTVIVALYTALLFGSFGEPGGLQADSGSVARTAPVTTVVAGQ